VRICSKGYIYKQNPLPAKEESVIFNWVGRNVGIVFSELGSFAEDLKELRDEAPRGVDD